MTAQTLDALAALTALGHQRTAELRRIQTMVDAQQETTTISAAIAAFRHQLANDFCTIQYYVLQGDQIDEQNT